MAQSTAGTNLVANTQATSRTIVASVRFFWDGSTPTFETTNLKSLTITRSLSSPSAGRAAPGGNVSTDLSITLHNPDGRYSPLNSSSPIYADIQNNLMIGTEVHALLGYNDPTNGDEILRRFTGFVTNPGLISSLQPEVTIQATGREYNLNTNRARTGLFSEQFPHQIMETLLTDAGIDPGDQLLDTGFHRIPWVWIEGENLMNQLQLIAEADGGFFYVDQSGNACFENNYHWMVDGDHTSSVITLDEGMYQRFSMAFEPQQLYNVIRVPYKPRRPGPKTTLFQLNELWVIPPSSTRIFEVKYKAAAVAIEPLVEGDHYVAIDAAGQRRSGALVVSVTNYGQSATVSVQNTNTVYQIELRQFRIDGIPLAGESTRFYEVSAADSAIGDPTSGGLVKAFDVRENEFLQTREQAEGLGNMLIDRMKHPRVTFMLSGCPGIPYLEIGDRITVDCTPEGVNSRAAYVTNIVERFSGGDRPVYESDLTCLDATGFFPRSPSDYFLLGTDAPHATTSKRVYY